MIIRNFKYKKGITLLELLITVVLISIAAAIGFSNFNQYSQMQNAKIAANQIAFILKKAKYYARSNGYPTKLIFTKGSTSYSFISNGVNLVQNNNFDASSGILPDNTKIISNSCSDIYFYVDGSIVDSSNLPINKTCTITVGYDNGSKETVSLESQTGNVIYD